MNGTGTTNGAEAARDYGDAAGLIESIREESARRVDAINDRARQTIEDAGAARDREIGEFRDSHRRETDLAIAREIAMMRNRAAIERRKLLLNAAETYIRSAVVGAVEDFRMQKEAYTAFLADAIAEVIAGPPTGEGPYPGSVTVWLTAGDAALEEALRRDLAGRAPGGGGIQFRTGAPGTGRGAVIEDTASGVTYNLTLDRIVYRKYDRIRNEALKILEKYGHAGCR